VRVNTCRAVSESLGLNEVSMVSGRLSVLAVRLLAGLVLVAVGCTGVANAETPYSGCLKSNGVPYDSNPGMYISVGKKVLNSGNDFYTAVNELEKEGAPPSEAAAIAACAKKVNCVDLIHCAP
jgi:hypothetical protein